jgi:hypothetical protein
MIRFWKKSNFKNIQILEIQIYKYLDFEKCLDWVTIEIHQILYSIIPTNPHKHSSTKQGHVEKR